MERWKGNRDKCFPDDSPNRELRAHVSTNVARTELRTQTTRTRPKRTLSIKENRLAKTLGYHARYIREIVS